MALQCTDLLLPEESLVACGCCNNREIKEYQFGLESRSQSHVPKPAAKAEACVSQQDPSPSILPSGKFCDLALLLSSLPLLKGYSQVMLLLFQQLRVIHQVQFQQC